MNKQDEIKTDMDISHSKLNYVLTVAVIAVLVLALAAAIILIVGGVGKPLEIADENGEEDYSLAVLTANEICAKEPKYAHKGYGIGIIDDSRSEENGGVYDADKIVGEARESFSGVTVLQSTYGKEDKVTFTITSERTKGNMRIVLVDEKMNILYDFAIGEASVYELENAKGKKYEIRIACESAEFNVTAERAFG